MLTVIFWACLGGVVYSYAIYPLLLLAISSVSQAQRDLKFVLSGSNSRVTSIGSADLPAVAIIISAYNEADCIRERVENLQALDYPKDRIKYYIGSDGSQDETGSILAAIEDPNLVFVDFEANRGKASVLNVLVRLTEAEYLVFSDANTHFNDDAVLKPVSATIVAWPFMQNVSRPFDDSWLRTWHPREFGPVLHRV